MGVTVLGRRSLLAVGAVSAWAIALLLWKLLTLSVIWVVGSVAIGCCLSLFLLWLRMTLPKTSWTPLWLIFAPFFISSLVTIPLIPFVPSLLLLVLIYLLLGLWGYVRFYPLHISKGLYRARFAIIDELSHLLSKPLRPDGLLLGIHQSMRHFVMVRPQSTRKEVGNLLIVGPTRSGKGLLAVSQLLSWQGSVVVNDIKGELFSATAGYRSTLGPVYVIDPKGLGHRFDPLTSRITEEDLESTAKQLLHVPEEKDAIFTQRATTMLMLLFSAARIEGFAPLPYVRHNIRSGLSATVERLQTVSPDLATQFLDVRFQDANLSDRFLLSSWGTLTARIRPLLTETLVRCFATSDFTGEDLIASNRPVSVYLRWPERDLLALSPLVRLLWGSLIDEVTTAYDSREGRGCRPVLMLIDEAGRTAIPSLAEHATTVVGRGVSLWIAIQSLSQLKVVYGEARAQVLRDNMESQIYYRPADLDTAEYLERRLGEKSGFAHSTTKRGGEESSSGDSERPVPLMNAQEIMQMKDEEIIGFHRRLPPFQLNRIDWRGHPLLWQRRRMAAPLLSPLPQLAEIPQIAGEGSGMGYIPEPDSRF